MEMRWWFCVCSLGILLLVPCALSEKFSLHGSPHPMVGIMGQDVVLPCQLSPQARLANMEVLWRKYSTAFILVHEYSDEGPKDQPGEGYQSRTELFPQEFNNGNVSLKLKRLQEADAGRYHCFVMDPDWSQEITTELRIAETVEKMIQDLKSALSPSSQKICSARGTLPAPILNMNQTSARPGDSVLFRCFVTSQLPATRIIFCKNGEEVSSQKGLKGKVNYIDNHVVSEGSPGNYSCWYEFKDIKNQVTRSQLSPAQHLSVTGDGSSRSDGDDGVSPPPGLSMSLVIWAARCILVLLLLLSAPVITFMLEKRGLPCLQG